MSPSETITRLRVRYAETDAMGIVHHSQYAIWFEAGRTDYFREKGLSYRECEARGVFLPVTELSVRFIQPAFYDEMVEIHTRVAEIRSRSVTVAYEARNERDEILATGQTRHICVDLERRVRSFPDWVMAVFEEAE